MEQVIQTCKDMQGYFYHKIHVRKAKSDVSLYVSSKIRKEWMLSEYADSILIEGWFYNIKWIDKKGGVWEVIVNPMERP